MDTFSFRSILYTLWLKADKDSCKAMELMNQHIVPAPEELREVPTDLICILDRLYTLVVAPLLPEPRLFVTLTEAEQLVNNLSSSTIDDGADEGDDDNDEPSTKN